MKYVDKTNLTLFSIKIVLSKNTASKRPQRREILTKWNLLGGDHRQVLNGVVDCCTLRPSVFIGSFLII